MSLDGDHNFVFFLLFNLLIAYKLEIWQHQSAHTTNICCIISQLRLHAIKRLGTGM